MPVVHRAGTFKRVSSTGVTWSTVSDRRRAMHRDQFWLTNKQFAKLKPHLPTDTRGMPRVE